jgi:ribosomal protein S18 acetylase RimI-like enzyme
LRATRTYLQLTAPAGFRPGFGTFPEVTIVRPLEPDPELYRYCYRTVGAAFHWRDRFDWTDAEIRRHLTNPAISFYVARTEGMVTGYYELRRVGEDDSVEIAYFGLVPDQVGRGLGKHLLSCAVRDAWSLRPRRVWLHTCTRDHPHALPNYMARGFVPYRTEHYEVDSGT